MLQRRRLWRNNWTLQQRRWFNPPLRHIRHLRFNLLYKRMRYGVVRVVSVPLAYNVTLVGLFASSVWWSIFCICFFSAEKRGALFIIYWWPFKVGTFGPCSQLPANRSKEYRLQAHGAALFVVLSVLVELGYTIGIKKSVLTPTTALEYLGFIADSENYPSLYLLARSSLSLLSERTSLPISLG